jgi:Zn-dependent protease
MMTVIGIILISSFLHECGHLLAAWLCAVRVVGLNVSWTKFAIRMVPATPDKQLFIALAGPMVNLLLAAVMTGFGMRMNLILAFGNLLPIRGFDGLKVVDAIVKYWSLRKATITRVA